MKSIKLAFHFLLIILIAPLSLFLNHFQPGWEKMKETHPVWFVLLSPIFFPLVGLMFLLHPFWEGLDK